MTLSGSSCLYNAEGRAADLPLNGQHYTLEFWMRSTGAGTTSGGFISWGSFGSTGRVNAFRLSGFSVLINYWWGNDLSATLGKSLADNVWHHLAATWDGTYRRIYVDFVQKAIASSSGYNVYDKSNFCVGKTYGHEYFTGQMSGIRIYNRAKVPTSANVAPQPTPPPPPPPPPPSPPAPPSWTLLLSADLSSHSLGDFQSGVQVGSLSTASTSDYRIGKSGAQLQAMGISRIKVETASGYSAVIEGPLDGNGFDGACSYSNCDGKSLGTNSLGVSYYWMGGNNGGSKPYKSGHFGLSTSSNVHVRCGTAGWWGHFHRSGVNTGVYAFGSACINENEWQERFFFYAQLAEGARRRLTSAGATPPAALAAPALEAAATTFTSTGARDSILGAHRSEYRRT